jgi:hypothetical protein
MCKQSPRPSTAVGTLWELWDCSVVGSSQNVLLLVDFKSSPQNEILETVIHSQFYTSASKIPGVFLQLVTRYYGQVQIVFPSL